jgi:hypothetical protein
MSRLRHRLTWSITVASAVLALAGPAAAATGPSAGRSAASPGAAAAAGINDNFNGDSCTSGTFCMAVGDYSLNGLTVGLSERLGGTGWIAEPVPSPAHGANIFANEVSCASPSSCLFVGDHWAGKSGPSANLAEFWNGTSWRIVTAPAPAKSTFNGIDDVACPTTKFCLAVGQSGGTHTFQDRAYTWTNGKTWRQIAVPKPSGARNSELGALSCSDAHACMATGIYENRSGHDVPFAARWHDGRWQLLATPTVRAQLETVFQTVSCPTATLCVAAGMTVDSTRHQYYHAFAEVWSGGKWHVSTLRKPPSLFIGISCPARNRCFASGYTFPSPTAYSRPLIETWNGRTWSTQRAVSTAAPRSADALLHVSCVNRSDCEAVGYRFKPKTSNTTQTVAEKWNGQRWMLQTTANP